MVANYCSGTPPAGILADFEQNGDGKTDPDNCDVKQVSIFLNQKHERFDHYKLFLRNIHCRVFGSFCHRLSLNDVQLFLLNHNVQGKYAGMFSEMNRPVSGYFVLE